MPKDHLRNIHFLLFVNGHWNPTTIVVNFNESFTLVDLNIQVVHGLVSLVVVSGIHKDLIIDFVEGRSIGNGLLNHLGLILVQNPLGLSLSLEAADVGVWALQNVLDGLEDGELFLDLLFLLTMVLAHC